MNTKIMKEKKPNKDKYDFNIKNKEAEILLDKESKDILTKKYDSLIEKNLTHVNKIKEKIEFGSMPSFNKIPVEKDDNESDSNSYVSDACDDVDDVPELKEVASDNFAEDIIKNMMSLSIDKPKRSNDDIDSIPLETTEVEEIDLESQIMKSFEEDQQIDICELRQETIKILDGYNNIIFKNFNNNMIKNTVNDVCYMLKRKLGNINHKKHIIESIVVKHIKSNVISTSIFVK